MGIDMETEERREQQPHAIDAVEWFVGFVIGAIAVLSLSLLLSGCKSISTCMDGSIFQINEYTGLTIGYGSARTISAHTEYCEQTEQVTTSWFNSNAKDYKRITIWASPFTNSPPSYLADAFKPNVNTDIIYSIVTNGESVLHFIRAEQNIKTSR